MELADEYAHLCACMVEGVDPKKDEEDIQAARNALETHLKMLIENAQATRVNTIRDVIGLLQVEKCNFYYNEPNDYGAITTTIFTGKGDPDILFCGTEVKKNFSDGVRGSGYYKLNDAIIPVIIDKLEREKLGNQ